MVDVKVITPYEEGQDAYWAGKSEMTNPYRLNSDEYLFWNKGYKAAAEDDDEEI